VKAWVDFTGEFEPKPDVAVPWVACKMGMGEISTASMESANTHMLCPLT